MGLLFEELQEGLRQAIDYEHDNGNAEVTMVRMHIDSNTIEKPILDKPYVSPFSYTQNDIERMKRRQERAGELGIRLLVLDGEDETEELQQLENEIVDNYIDRDLDVPEELKEKYLELKKLVEQR